METNVKKEIKTLQVNKKAYFNYSVLEDLEAGISLAGTEVKSLRAGKFSFVDSYIKIDNGELWLVGFTIRAPSSTTRATATVVSLYIDRR